MIARIRRGSASEEAQEEHLALERSASGEWVPLTSDADKSSDAAVRRCVGGIQKQLAQLEQHVERQTGIMRDNLERLWDTARPTDVVRIGLEVCPVDEAGMIAIPEVDPSPRLRDRLAELVTDDVYKTLRKSLKLPRKRAKAIGLIVDLTLNAPLQILGGVSDKRPADLGAVAAFMARVHQATCSQGSDEKETDK